MSQPKLDKPTLLKTVMGLIAMGDVDLLEEQRVISLLGAPIDFERICRLAQLLSELFRDFDYTRSPEFERSVEGKSPAFVDMKKKFAREPVKASEHRERYKKGLSDLLENQSAYELTPISLHDQLDEIRRLIYEIENPDITPAN